MIDVPSTRGRVGWRRNAETWWPSQFCSSSCKGSIQVIYWDGFGSKAPSRIDLSNR